MPKADGRRGARRCEPDLIQALPVDDQIAVPLDLCGVERPSRHVRRPAQIQRDRLEVAIDLMEDRDRELHRVRIERPPLDLAVRDQTHRDRRGNLVRFVRIAARPVGVGHQHGQGFTGDAGRVPLGRAEGHDAELIASRSAAASIAVGVSDRLISFGSMGPVQPGMFTFRSLNAYSATTPT